MEVDIRDRPVFICGHPKSGTSLIRSLLDAHPELVVYPEETMFFRRYLPKVKGLPLEQKLTMVDQYLTHIFEWNQTAPPPSQAGFPDRDYSNVPFEKIRQNVRKMVDQQFRHDGDMLSAVILSYGDVKGCRNPNSKWWVEKNPYNELYTDKIYSWWKDAKCIHVIRDPRDNFVSYQRKHKDWSGDIFALNWYQSTQAGLTNQKRYGKSNYWIFKYEDFTRSPELYIKQLCDFLGIQDDETLRSPLRNGKPWGGNSMFSEKFSQISNAPVGRWEQSIKKDDLFLIEQLTKPLMKIFGYELSVDSGGSSSVTLKTYWRLLKSRILRLK